MAAPITYQGENFRSIAALASHLSLSQYQVRTRYLAARGRPICSGAIIEASDMFKTKSTYDLCLLDLSHDGKKITYAEASEISGISPQTLRSRFLAGWSNDRILTQPVKGSS